MPTQPSKAANTNNYDRILRDLKRELSDLDTANASNIAARQEVESNISARKKRGSRIRNVGIAVAFFGAAPALGLTAALGDKGILVIAGFALLSILLIVLGCRISTGAKAYAAEKSALDVKLSDYDSAAGRIRSKIREVEHEQFQERISAFSHGYVGLYATSEFWMGDKPNEPAAKKYDCTTLDCAQIQINDMVYSTLTRKYGKRCIDFVKLDESGTQKLQVAVQYVITNEKFDWVSSPVPFKPQDESVFIWIHVSTCMKGTKVFCNCYEDLEVFMQDTGITEDEIMEILEQYR